MFVRARISSSYSLGMPTRTSSSLITFISQIKIPKKNQEESALISITFILLHLRHSCEKKLIAVPFLLSTFVLVFISADFQVFLMVSGSV